MPAILGISPGTRSVGFAVLKDGKLTEYRVQSFQEAWTYQKLKKIINCIRQEIERNGIQGIAVKIPDTQPTSSSYIQLLGAMNVCFERKGIKARYYTLSDIKWHFRPDRRVNKAVLAECTIAKHPDLLPEYRKEQGNRNVYYDKLFEAVAAVDLLQREVINS